MLVNKLKVNDDKTEFLKFLPQSQHEHITPSSIKIGAESIDTSAKAKNLGVIIDLSLNLASHITATGRAANYQLHCLSRIKRYLTPDALKAAVHALISSKLDYCNSLLAGLPKYEIHKNQHIMNSAARLISGTRKCDHITPVLSSLHWLPVEHRINFKLMCLTYKALHGSAPTYLTDLLVKYCPVRSLRSVEQGLLTVPKACTVRYGKQAFAYIAPALYNQLPMEVRKSPTLNTFKSRLKTHYFKLAY